MLTRVATTATLVALTAYGLASQTPAAQKPPAIGGGTGAISGTVTDATTGRPVAAAIVSLTPQSGNVVGAAARQITDATGRFIFTKLEAGDGYLVGATRFGYFGGGYGRRSATGQTRRIALKDAEWVRDIAVPLWRPAAVIGRVLDEAGEPVVGAYVRAMAELLVAGQPQIAAGATVQTDDRGVYRLAGLTPGRYYIVVPSVQWSVPGAASVPTLSGTSVEAIAVTEASGRQIALRNDPAIALGGDSRLLIGSFATPPPPAADGRSEAYPAYYHPAARSRSEALGLDLSYGDDRVGIDVRIRPVPTAVIAGRVDGPAEARANLTLRLMPLGDESLGPGGETATALVAPDGSFAFLNVPTGSYTIDATRAISEYTFSGNASDLSVGLLPAAPGSSGRGGGGSAVFSGPPGTALMTRGANAAGGYFGRLRVDVAGGEVTGLVLPLRRGVTVSGTIVPEGATRPSSLNTLVQAEPAGGEAALGQPRSTSPPDAPLEFTIEGLRPGEYLLRLIAGPGTVKSIEWGGKDLTHAPFDASAAQDFRGVVITTTTQAVRIDGVVTDGRGAPVPGAAVIYFPVEREQWRRFGLQPARLRSVLASSTGTFSVLRIPAGEYYVIAVDEALASRWQDPAFLDVASRLATRVNVAWGETKTQDLVLRPLK